MIFKEDENEHIVIISTCTIFHPCIDVSVLKDYAYITSNFFNKKQARQDLQRQLVFITYSYYDYILYKNKHERHINNDKNSKYLKISRLIWSQFTCML